MKHSQRQAIQEVLDACRAHEKAVADIIDGKPTDLNDIIQGLAISATKLEEVLNEDKADKGTAKRLCVRLQEKVDIGSAAVRDLRAKVVEASKTPNIFNLNAPYYLAKEIVVRDNLRHAQQLAKQAGKDGRNPADALRSWIEESRRSMRVLRIDERSPALFWSELAGQEGLKQACLVVEGVLDFPSR